MFERSVVPDVSSGVFQGLEEEANAVCELSEALAAASHDLWGCREERSVLERALDAIHARGFLTAVLLLDGDALVHGPMRQDPESVREGERFYGKPIEQVRFERARVAHLDELFAQRKSAFHPDFHAVLARFHAPQVAAFLRERYPLCRGLDAPIFVENAPYGLLSVHGPTLTPTCGATLTLFARHIGGAIENVRHHQRAAERMAELARLQAELIAQERLAVLGEAAAVVAHEVRNPLGAILNAVAVLKRDAGVPGSPRASAVRMVEEEAMRLDTMVRDLLNAARPLEPRPKALQLGAVAERTLALFRERAESPGVRLVLERMEGLPSIRADEQLLHLALENLVRNAVQASPAEGTVRVVVGAGEACVKLTVEDEGAGISETDAARVFEPFFTTRATGTGLGLAVVKRVVVAHGGSVHLGQREGGGARFELRLPL